MDIGTLNTCPLELNVYKQHMNVKGMKRYLFLYISIAKVIL